MTLRRRFSRSWEKNGPEVQALVSGRLPSFVTRPTPEPPDDVPVFTFHAVEPERFERQLAFLSRNGYRTLSADAWLDGAGDSRSVVLTFDDADWTFWAYAYPLLRAYDAVGVVFVVPGLVPDRPDRRPTLDDVDAGRATVDEVASAGTPDDVCSWAELREMAASPHVDVQAHSMTHSAVATSPTIIDIVRPGLGFRGYKWVNVPITSRDDAESPTRPPAWGTPMFAGTSRLGRHPRFVDNAELTAAFVARAADAPSPDALDDARWRRELTSIADRWSGSRGRVESPDSRAEAIRGELASAKATLAERLNVDVTHHCHPWFVGSDTADEAARDAGYRAVHYGIDAPPRDSMSGIVRVRRMSEHFVERLPGTGRISLASIVRLRLTGRRT